MTSEIEKGRGALLPCPFCGGQNIMTVNDADRYSVSVQCVACSAAMPACVKADAILYWNTRTPASGASARNVETRARELLAAAYEAMGGQWGHLAATVRAGLTSNWPMQSGTIPLRAIEAALNQGAALRSAGRGEG